MKVTEKKYYEVDWQDFEKFVQDEFRIFDWSFVEDVEGRNDSSYAFRVDGKLRDYQEERIQGMIKSGKQTQLYCTQFLLDKLAAQGKIPCGDYLITVYW